jgi:alpha-mannosidase
MITVHVILNAHIDPIWLWPWQSGLDTVLNTCRSVCDLLDRNPDAIFTCGEAWKYAIIEQCDPQLFARIKAHVTAGRWEPIGWWIQPDCNFPSHWAIGRSIDLALHYFGTHFGMRPAIGYNVDSFGHAAALPGLMRQMGQDCYVMMRPKENEMQLPARVFRWRGHDDGPEVTVFRIARSYSEAGDRLERIKLALSDLPDGITDTIFFVGVGDHGGGPSQTLVNWCRDHAEVVPGAKLAFSSPSKFFAAIAGKKDRLPLVTGELQHHAVGCYSVHRSIKLAIRTAEHALLRAERAVEGDQEINAVEDAWSDVCFNHFHDTLGGTCIASAYIAPLAQLGGVIALADRQLQISLRRWMAALPRDPLQRIVVWNPGPWPFKGYIEFEPWIEGRAWDTSWRLLDEQGLPAPIQIVASEAAVTGLPRLLFHVDLPAEGRTIFRIDPTPAPTRTRRSQVTIRRGGFENAEAFGIAGISTKNPKLILAGRPIPLPYLELIDDPTDTWSHGIDRYADAPARRVKYSAATLHERGPIRASILRQGTIGASQLQEHWLVTASERFVELRLRVGWLERRKILKLVWPIDGKTRTRIDGIMGKWLQRAFDGAERPVRDFLLVICDPVRGKPASRQAVVCPHVFAADVTTRRIRLTLLRSPLMAHHIPHPAEESPETPVADWGAHEFTFRFFADASPDELDAHAMMLQRPPLIGEWTAGMGENVYHLE